MCACVRSRIASFRESVAVAAVGRRLAVNEKNSPPTNGIDAGLGWLKGLTTREQIMSPSPFGARP